MGATLIANLEKRKAMPHGHVRSAAKVVLGLTMAGGMLAACGSEPKKSPSRASTEATTAASPQPVDDATPSVVPTGITVKLSPDRSGPADRVGCGALALNPDGRSDRVFVLEFAGIPPKSEGLFIESIVLERLDPPGIWPTAGVNYVLGVGERGNDVLMNRPDGSVRIAAAQQIRTFACNDGADGAASMYRVHVKIGSAELVSPSVTPKVN